MKLLSFNAHEARTVTAITERLFPADGSVDHFRPLHGVTTLDALTYARLPVVVMPLPFYTYCR